MIRIATFLTVLVFLGAHSHAQQYQPLVSGKATNLRGLSTPSANIIWASGSAGTITRSVDGGKTWKWMTVRGFEKKDFRDIHAFDSSTAIIMAIDNPAYILKTTNGGETWRVVFTKEKEGIFLDAMEFQDDKRGICVGDPLPGAQLRFYILETNDGGETWSESQTNVPASTGEGIFAASGTNLTFLKDSKFRYCFVSGGLVANLNLVDKSGKVTLKPIPIHKGTESSGAFSVTAQGNNLYIVGGDYKAPYDSMNTVARLNLKSLKWNSLAINAKGFRSCIKLVNGGTFVACGTSGIDMSIDGGLNWKNIDLTSFNVCMVTTDHSVIFAGEKGRIASVSFR